MSGHTWKADCDEGRFHRIEDELGRTIADTYEPDASIGPEEDRANSLILAASLELADALEAAVAFEDEAADAMRRLGLKTRERPWMAQARAALAKAGRALTVLACLALLTLTTACASSPPRDPCAEPCSEDGRPCAYYMGQCHPAQGDRP